MRRLALALIWPALLGALALLLISFAGRLHPAGDSFAVFRLQIASAALILAFFAALLGARAAIAVAAAVLLLAAPTAFSYLGGAAAAPGTGAVIYQKNLNFRSGDLAAIAADIRATGADIVTLQEVSDRNRALLDMLKADYPTQAYCRFLGVGGTAVLSRWPATAGEPICGQSGGMTALRLEAPEGTLWAVSIHLHWPWPYGQADHVARLLPDIEALEGDIVLGGDFNMVPWGSTVTRIAEAARTRKAGPTAITLALRYRDIPVPLPIDHVLVPLGWTATQDIRPELGSDHRGVLVRFSRP